MAKEHIDPEYERWYRKFPNYPGFQKCVELLGSSNVQGAWVDVICHELGQHAHEETDELLSLARSEIGNNSWVGRILLQVIANAKLPDAFDLFAELLKSPDESLQNYAIDGLQQLNTKEARQLLWQHANS